MSDQLDIDGREQPLTWDGQPLYSAETVAEGLFAAGAFEQMRGQISMGPEIGGTLGEIIKDLRKRGLWDFR